MPIYQTTSGQAAEFLTFSALAEAGARTLWPQLGRWHEPVAGRATETGLDVVMNRCVKIEHPRFAGGLQRAGFNTGVISSRRQSAP